ncbi:MAG: hypothetical protein ACLQPD_04660 [Desulfomonilaceae bacterium]
MKADRHPRISKVIPGIAIIALVAVYGFLVFPYKVPLLSLVNGCFLGAGLTVVAALSKSWIQTITPWLRGVALLLMAAYVVAVAVFWIQWMSASCQ